MNRKQKARKLKQRQRHAAESRAFATTATMDTARDLAKDLAEVGTAFVDKKTKTRIDPSQVAAEREVISSGKRFAELHDHAAPPIVTTPKPQRRRLLRRSAPNMAQAAEAAMAADGFVKVDEMRTREIEIEAVLEPAIEKAKRAKKTAVLLREMDAAGYRPKEGTKPTPSKTTAADWEYVL